MVLVDPRTSARTWRRIDNGVFAKPGDHDMPLRQDMAGQRRLPATDDPRPSPMRKPRGYLLDHGDHQFHKSGSPLAMNADIHPQADRRPAPGRALNHYQEHDVESPRFDHLRLRRSPAGPNRPTTTPRAPTGRGGSSRPRWYKRVGVRGHDTPEMDPRMPAGIANPSTEVLGELGEARR